MKYELRIYRYTCAPYTSTRLVYVAKRLRIGSFSCLPKVNTCFFAEFGHLVCKCNVDISIDAF
jgi:hypothetical protein